MKKLLGCLLVMIQCQMLTAQSVGIGTATPNASAQLDVTSITKGLLIPRMTGAQRNAIASPAIGLLVIQTNTEVSPPSSPGLYLYEQPGLLGIWRRIARTDEITGGTPTWTVNGNNQYSNVSGSVGIGTSTPHASAKLDLSSTTQGLLIPRMTVTQRNAIASPAIGLMVYDTNNEEFFYYDGTIWQKVLNGTYDYWNKSGSRKWVYNTTDSIGIGTASPDAKFEVIGNVKTSGRIDAGGVVEAAGLSSIGVLYINGTSLLQGAVTGNSSATFSSTITSNTAMTINDAAGIFTFKTGSADKGFMQLSGDDFRIGTFSSNNTGKFIVRVNGINTFNITPAYNVGIGTETPSAKLHVVGKIFANASGEAIKLDGSNPNIGFYQNGTYHGFISQSGTELFVGVNNGNLHLDGQQVAIGTVVPAASAYKLSVSGKIICEELKVKLVSSGWPDYVFDSKYNLPNLAEVEKFIQQNKHLPNIPSAAEVEKNGIEVGDMQKRMMEKIEELTLYTISLQKQIDELKKQR